MEELNKVYLQFILSTGFYAGMTATVALNAEPTTTTSWQQKWPTQPFLLLENG